jgi:hypothetical protein
MKMLKKEETTTPVARFATHSITLPLANHLLPPNSLARITRTLWSALLDSGEPNSQDEILNDLSFYVAFALLGLIGFERERTATGETLLIPVAFESGTSVMRLTVRGRTERLPELILSLPGERELYCNCRWLRPCRARRSVLRS